MTVNKVVMASARAQFGAKSGAAQELPGSTQCGKIGGVEAAGLP